MFFHKDSQQAFVFPPKCGTHTTIKFLNECGWKGLGKRHFVPERLIELYPNLQNYQIYLWIRDPLLRFESGLLHVKRSGLYGPILDEFLIEKGINKTRESVSYEEIIDVFPDFKQKFHPILAPQSKWANPPNIVPLDFQNMESELRRITGNQDQPFVIWNQSNNFGRSVITQKVIDFVRQEYAADYALAKDRLGKEY